MFTVYTYGSRFGPFRLPRSPRRRTTFRRRNKRGSRQLCYRHQESRWGDWPPKWGGTAQQEHATAVLNTHKSHRHPSGTNPGSLENNFELILKGEEKFPFSNYCNERGVAVLDRERVIVTPFQNSALDSGQHFIEIETNCL